MEINTLKIKTEIIEHIRAVNVFIANNQGFIDPANLADVYERLERLEAKLKTAFKEDEALDPLIEDYKNQTERQRSLLKFQKSKLSKELEADNDDEYKGEVIRYV